MGANLGKWHENSNSSVMMIFRLSVSDKRYRSIIMEIRK
jgi:hypothetical protein